MSLPHVFAVWQHAVTLYEVGKIADEALDAFVGALSGVERPPIDEADVLEYFDQAIALCHAITFLRCHPACALDGTVRPLDIVRTESLASMSTATRDRVLVRSYALLISMAPMVPAAELIFTPSLPVAHLGPTYALLASPWLPIAVCEAMGRGPVAVVLPRGTRLRALPRALRGCTHVRIVPWAGEPLVVAVSSILSVVSELLLRSPLLVQEYVADATASTASVALPITDEANGDHRPGSGPAGSDGGPEGYRHGDVLNNGAGDGTGNAPPTATGEAHRPSDLSDGGGANGAGAGATAPVAAPVAAPASASAAAGPPAHDEALALQRALGLEYSIGRVELVRALRDGGAVWLPTGIHFGLALSNVHMCRAACEAISSRQLFTLTNLEKHASSLAALLARVERCVERCASAVQCSDGEAMADEVGEDEDEPSPSCPLFFDGTQLLKLGQVSELC